MARGCSTSTDDSARPATWTSNPRRTTSTSGSSGIFGGRELRGQRLPSLLGGLLLRFLLRATVALAVVATADQDRRGELLAVVRSLFVHSVLGHAETGGSGQLLHAGLPVQAGATQGRPVPQPVRENWKSGV